MAFPSKPSTATISGSATATDDDYLIGTSGDDIITGGDGPTIAYIADGLDIMQGGAGDDQYIVNNTTGSDVIIEYANEGVDTVFSSVNYILPSEVENIVASMGAVTLTGNLKDNIIDGSNNGAVDTLVGLAGNDTYILDAGDKVIEGKAATAIVTSTTQYADTAGIDTISSADSVDIHFAINDPGQLVLGSADIKGQAFIENVILTGSSAVDITGNAKNNILTGNSAANAIIGNAGDDILNGGANADNLTGGVGNDIYIVDDIGDVVNETSLGTVALPLTPDGVNGTVDLVKSSVTYSIASAAAAGVENLTLTGIALINATGNTKVNILTGNSNNNTLIGGAGNDTLYGLQGNDTLNGGLGVDNMTGGRGDDTYIVDSSSDVVTELVNPSNVTANGTADHVKSSVTYLLTTPAAAGVEKLTLTGSGNVNATGNALPNFLVGNSGNNILNGGTGIDDLQGAGGNDTYYVDNTSDKVSDTAGTLDTVISSVDFNLAAGTITTTSGSDTNAENLTLTGSASNATGNASDNTIIGNAIANVIDGGAGADNMQGGAGNDSYFVDNTGDKVTDTLGTDTINTSVTFNMATAGSGVENLTVTNITTTNSINLTGNTLANTITGNAGDNIIIGGAGNDAISAGAGDDTITGGAGKDTITTGVGADTISFATGVADTVATATSVAGIDVYSLLDFATDKISLSVTVASVVAAAAGSNAISEATFITDMNTALTKGAIGTGFKVASADITAAIVTATTGGGGVTAGDEFLAVDLDSSGTFTATDFVIEITGFTGTLAIGSFI
ncbi:beta strand repeat-containing protein [Crenothrix sp.]|uniref:beta strand repeat-containing protein n=1 Tax=Crenothrix sp. TaxID=3100433 RepID=UPI00374DD913